MLKNAGRIKGAGAYLYIDNHDDIKFSQKTFKSKLLDTPQLQDYFADAVADELKKIPMDVISSQSQNYTMSSTILNKINSVSYTM
jgi:hypothetical protein